MKVIRPDIRQLSEFYDSPLGKVFCRILRAEIRRFWPDIFGDGKPAGRLLGIGFTTPYLQMFLPRVGSAVSLMPGGQGVIAWPSHPGAKNISFAADETKIPLADNSMDRILLVHSFEYIADLKCFTRELWRVLKPEGKLLLAAPNRFGLWARSEKSPLSQGRPFSRLQLESLFSDSLFSILKGGYSVFIPPTESRFLLKNYGIIEKAGRALAFSCGGVLMLEAEKRVYATLPGVMARKARAVANNQTVLRSLKQEYPLVGQEVGGEKPAHGAA